MSNCTSQKEKELSFEDRWKMLDKVDELEERVSSLEKLLSKAIPYVRADSDYHYSLRRNERREWLIEVDKLGVM